MKLLAIAFSVASANIYQAIQDDIFCQETESMSRREKKRVCSEKNWPNGLPEACDKCYQRGDALEGQLMLFSNARNYGCWCDLENALRRASRGQPLNALDQACMDLHHGYNCIQIDQPNCNARTANATVDYFLPLASISPIMDPKQQCQLYNQGNICGQRICQVEAEFLRVTYQPVYSGDQDWLDMWNDNDYVHDTDGGNFDFEGVCNSAGRGGPPNPRTPSPPLAQGDKKCCGSYPYRNAYYTGRANCCSNVISPLGTC